MADHFVNKLLFTDQQLCCSVPPRYNEKHEIIAALLRGQCVYNWDTCPKTMFFYIGSMTLLGLVGYILFKMILLSLHFGLEQAREKERVAKNETRTKVLDCLAPEAITHHMQTTMESQGASNGNPKLDDLAG